MGPRTGGRSSRGDAWEGEHSGQIANPNGFTDHYYYYNGNHVYVGEATGSNVFGTPVSCKVFGPIPRRQYTLVAQCNAASERATKARLALTAKVKRKWEARIAANPTGQTYVAYGMRLEELRDFFAQREFSTDHLREQESEQFMKAATAFYKAGAVTWGSKAVDKITGSNGKVHGSSKQLAALVVAMIPALNKFMPTAETAMRERCIKQVVCVYHSLPAEPGLFHALLLAFLQDQERLTEPASGNWGSRSINLQNGEVDPSDTDKRILGDSSSLTSGALKTFTMLAVVTAQSNEVKLTLNWTERLLSLTPPETPGNDASPRTLP